MPPKQKRRQETNKAPIDATLAKHAKETAALEEDVKLESKEAKPEAAGKFSLCTQLTDSSWREALCKEMQEPYFQELEAKLAEAYKGVGEVCPPLHLIFNAFNLTPLDKVKVVIIGQDPYHNNNQAMGLAFSVPKDSKIPRSLYNIYKELENDIPGFSSPDHGCLQHWASQGVLLLNATLTVAQHKPNSHNNLGWQKFTDRVIQIINDKCEKVVYLLWGNFAHKKGELVDKKHVVLKSAHPSSLSFGKFLNCKCFSQANNELEKSGLTPIDWRLPPSTL